MELKLGYKHTEDGVIPDDWDVCNLVTISSKITDGDHVTPKRQREGDYLLSARNIRDGHIDLTDVDYVGHEEYERMRRRCAPEVGDILISCSGHGLGRVSSVPEGLRCVLVRSAALIKLNPRKANSLFIQYCLQGSYAQNQISISKSLAAQPNLFITSIERLRCLLPATVSEQRAIAAALSDADALIQSLEELIGKKRHFRQGAMHELLTGKKRLPGFSGEWRIKSLGDLFNFSGGFSASREQLSTEGHCYLHYGDIHMSKKNFVDVRQEHQDIPKLNIPLNSVSPVSLLEDGDVVFVDASEDDEGTSKHVVIVNKSETPFISGLHTIVAKSKTNELEHQYRRYCFQTTAVKRQFRFFAVGTKVSGISKSNIPRITLPVPEPPEQRAIASILSDLDGEIAALEAKLCKIRQIKQGMMQELLTGKVRLI
jgi:type I restriction enzyme S subunit